MICVKHPSTWAWTLETADGVDALKLADSFELLTLINVYKNVQEVYENVRYEMCNKRISNKSKQKAMSAD